MQTKGSDISCGFVHQLLVRFETTLGHEYYLANQRRPPELQTSGSPEDWKQHLLCERRLHCGQRVLRRSDCKFSPSSSTLFLGLKSVSWTCRRPCFANDCVRDLRNTRKPFKRPATNLPKSSLPKSRITAIVSSLTKT